MQVKNTSARLWTIRSKINVLPGHTVEVPDEYAADVTGHQDLKIVAEKYVPLTEYEKAEAESDDAPRRGRKPKADKEAE